MAPTILQRLSVGKGSFTLEADNLFCFFVFVYRDRDGGKFGNSKLLHHAGVLDFSLHLVDFKVAWLVFFAFLLCVKFLPF